MTDTEAEADSVGSEMTAVGFHEHGSIDQLQKLTVPVPEIAPNEVLVDVKATALNHLDVFAVRELDHYVPSYPFWSGGDIAGDVAAVGADVTDREPGERVLVDPIVVCEKCEYCRRGDHARCPNLQTIGEHRHGGLAEYVAVPERNLVTLPEQVAYETAASVPIAGTTAWGALVTRGEIGPYEDVLVVGATGGVGTFAVQIAREVYNVDTLYATTSTEEKAEYLRDLGADHVINYTEEAFDEQVWELTDKRGVDVCYNCVGGETWVPSMRALRNGGRLITSGATAGPNPETELRLVFIRGLDILGSSVDSKDGFHRLLEYVWDGTIDPVIDATLPLSEYRGAFERIVDRDLYGKVVLTQD
jgi:NADPH:quinone reductase-like Zn-dependent oxidoreductase